MKLTGNTSEMLRQYVGNRKKGHIFINSRTGLTLRHFAKMTDKLRTSGGAASDQGDWGRLQDRQLVECREAETGK